MYNMDYRAETEKIPIPLEARQINQSGDIIIKSCQKMHKSNIYDFWNWFECRQQKRVWKQRWPQVLSLVYWKNAGVKMRKWKFSSWYVDIKGLSKQTVGKIKCAGLHFRNKARVSLTGMGIMCIEMVGRRCTNGWRFHEAQNEEPQFRRTKSRIWGRHTFQSWKENKAAKKKRNVQNAEGKRKG